MKKILFFSIMYFMYLLIHLCGYAYAEKLPEEDKIDSYFHEVEKHLQDFNNTKDEHYLTLAKLLNSTAVITTINKMTNITNKLLEDELEIKKATMFSERRYGTAGTSANILIVSRTLMNMNLSKACNNYNRIAKGYLLIKNKEEAKHLYRHVVTNFAENDFHSCSREAEFGLEDLKNE